jgi:RNA polymerase sigma factor (sigma-70 family)
MELTELELEKLGTRLRYKVRHEVGFACPDIDDLVQESLKRFLDAFRAERIRSHEAAGAFLNGICRNVISEYRRHLFRDAPMPEVPPEPAPKGLPPTEVSELREAIAEGMNQLSRRDRQVLRAFYLEEKSVEEILQSTGLTLANFRVVLCRAKERFRQVYLSGMKSQGAAGH